MVLVMDQALVMLAAGAAATPLAFIWERHHKARDAARAECARLGHDYGAPFSLYNEGQYWQRKCQRCGDQMNCNADGSKYVPRR
jgi:hypothetical protein